MDGKIPDIPTMALVAAACWAIVGYVNRKHQISEDKIQKVRDERMAGDILIHERINHNDKETSYIKGVLDEKRHQETLNK